MPCKRIEGDETVEARITLACSFRLGIDDALRHDIEAVAGTQLVDFGCAFTGESHGLTPSKRLGDIVLHLFQLANATCDNGGNIQQRETVQRLRRPGDTWLGQRKNCFVSSIRYSKNYYTVTRGLNACF